MPGSVTPEAASTCDESTSRHAYNPDSSDENNPIDPDLIQIVNAWPKLPPAIRTGVLAMIRATEEEVQIKRAD